MKKVKWVEINTTHFIIAQTQILYYITAKIKILYIFWKLCHIVLNKNTKSDIILTVMRFGGLYERRRFEKFGEETMGSSW